MLRGRLGRRIPIKRKVNNFGDLLGPEIVKRMLDRAGVAQSGPAGDGRLFAIGSVLHFAATGDVVWGTGVNGKASADKYDFTRLDVRAVRGPRTRKFLVDRGVAVPEVYGDPGLLTAELFPEIAAVASEKKHRVTVVPNLNDLASYTGDVLVPTRPLVECLTRIAQSELVVGSSLHGIIVAESFGIPARLVASPTEHAFKYEDYYAGSGRPGFTAATSVQEAVELGGEPPVDWNPQALIDAFPLDLWTGRRS